MKVSLKLWYLKESTEAGRDCFCIFFVILKCHNAGERGASVSLSAKSPDTGL